MYAPTVRVLLPPNTWVNQDIYLYHGTVDAYAPSIASGNIDVRQGRIRTDFGPGFYTTTVEGQALAWARQKRDMMNADPNRGTPVQAQVVEIVLPRERLARLDTLAFVRGEFGAEDFWSFVHHCRLGAANHGRISGVDSSYDAVYGPVAGIWDQRVIINRADQISFHTAQAQDLLNDVSISRRIL